MGRHSMIKELHDGTDRWTIVVRVFRKWNVYYKTAPSKLFCISMVLIDEEGCKIQASVLNKDLHEKFRNSISEGKTYKFANFVVTQNVGQYRATTNDFKLSFTPQTYVLEQHASIPFYSYSFMPITEILKIDQDHQVNHLIDVLAFVRSIATLEEFRRDNKTKMKLRMQLTDDEENEVDCVLFDGVASNALMDQLQNNETPVVIVLNLARIGFSEDGIPTLYNSFNATRAAFNPAIKEVKQFIESSKDGFSPVLTSLNKPRPSQSTRMSSVGSLHSQTKITISQIAEQEIGSSFVISCEILKLETRYGWTYDGCSKCGKKATSENSTVVCPSCTRKSQLKIEPKLKVHYVVKDKTGSVSVIFWDKLAVQLIQKTAADLKLILQNEKCEYDFPDELDSPVGKSVLLKLKINDYNKKHPTSSISVGQFTICEYLMNQFMEATNESALLSISTEENAEEDLGQLVVTRSPVKQNAVTEIPQPPSLGEKIHDTVLFDLTNQVTPAPVKEKRRINVKRNIVRDDAAPTFKFPAVICSDERVAKVIKQEK